MDGGSAAYSEDPTSFPSRGRSESALPSAVLSSLVVLGLIGLVLVALRAALARPQALVKGHDIIQAYNWESVTRRALSEGVLPLWNPYVLAGMPALADVQVQMFYPVAALLRVLPITQYFIAPDRVAHGDWRHWRIPALS